jgi:Sugar (and other) transporter
LEPSPPCLTSRPTSVLNSTVSRFLVLPPSIMCKHPLYRHVPGFLVAHTHKLREKLIERLCSGSIVTSPVGAIISDKYGRKIGMFCGAWVIILGAVIAATSSKMAQLVVGRFILGAGIQMMTVAAPAYAIEIAPPHWRGRCAGKTPDCFPCIIFCHFVPPEYQVN